MRAFSIVSVGRGPSRPSRPRVVVKTRVGLRRGPRRGGGRRKGRGEHQHCDRAGTSRYCAVTTTGNALTVARSRAGIHQIICCITNIGWFWTIQIATFKLLLSEIGKKLPQPLQLPDCTNFQAAVSPQQHIWENLDRITHPRTTQVNSRAAHLN